MKKKRAEDLNRRFSKKTSAEQVYKNPLNIMNHQGKADQNHSEVSSHSS